MGVSYDKEMRKRSKDQDTSLVTIDIPGLQYQTPSADKKMVDELLALFTKWQKEKKV